MTFVLASSHSSTGFVSKDEPSSATSGHFLVPLTTVHSFADLKAHCHALAQVR